MAAKQLLVLAAVAALARADCPNACSGHGDCGTKDQCQCYDGFYGGDCSLRVCPVGTAFVDTPAGDLNHDGRIGYDASSSSYSKVQWSRYMAYEAWPRVDKTGAAFASVAGSAARDVDASVAVGGWKAQAGEAHFLVECSGKGACDRNLGVCKCFDGYTGAACQRTTCPNDCSGHGVCRTVSEIASAGARTFEQSVAGVNQYGGVSAPFEYRLWDAEQNAACVCDVGYSGIDCSLRECPRGDDPLTTTSSTCGGACVDEVQSFSVDGGQGPSAPGTYYLTFTDFNGRSFRTKDFTLVTAGASLGADWDSVHRPANEAAVKAALEALPNNVTGLVTVSTLAGSGGASAKEQLRLSVTFTTKSGNVPEMSLGWVGSSTRRSYVFQPGQPVKYFTVPAAQQTAIQFKVSPVDSSLYGKESYWTSSLVTIPVTATSVADLTDSIVEALNSIPAIKLQYGAPFVRDGNVVTSPEDPTVSSPAHGVDVLTVRIAFPDKQFGANKLTFAFGSVAGAGADTASSYDDVINGNKEAAICSNRGICDYSNGACSCFSGYTGVACEVQSALAYSA